MTAPDRLVWQLVAGGSALNALLVVNYLAWIAGTPPPALAWLLLAVMVSCGSVLLLRPLRTWPLLLFLLCMVLVALGTPTADWDSRSIWLFHAKRIYVDGSLYGQLDGYGGFSHSDYPVMYPALAATLADAVGHWNEVFPKSAAVLFLLAPLMICSAALRYPSGAAVLLGGLLVVCGRYLTNGFMDALLAVYFLASVVVLMMQARPDDPEAEPFRGRLGAFALAGCLAVMSALKNEGFVAVLLLLAVAIVLQWGRPGWPRLLAFVPALLLVPLTWKTALARHDIHGDLLVPGLVGRLIARLLDPADLGLILRHMLAHGGFWMLVLLALFFLRARFGPRLYWYPCLAACLYFGVLAAVYLSTPNDLAWHLTTSVDRTLLPINVLVLGTVSFLASELLPRRFFARRR
jgi:hypothetical protein